MHHFHYREGELYCEDVPLTRIAAEIGTPVYVYSQATLERHYRAFTEGLGGVDHLVCFAVKACANIAVLNLLGRMGAGADIVSGGELYRALQARIPADRIVYSGVGKTRSELREALLAGIRLFNVESEQELDRLDRIAAELGVRAPVALRVNPDVDPGTHAYISTGLSENKFGLPPEQALAAYERAVRAEHLDVRGVSCHIGSQLTAVEPFVEAVDRLLDFVEALRDRNIAIDHLDLGGGLGIPYDQEQPPHPSQYVAALLERVAPLGCTLVFEPGRVISGNAGVLVTEVQYVKENRAAKDGGKRFVVVDAAMNDLTRPSLYGAYHQIWPVREAASAPLETVDVVGPICETGDFLARDRALPPMRQDDLLAVLSCGAYGFTMSSNYNSRPRAAEVLVRGGRFQVIRRREDYDDLVCGERLSELG